MTRTLRRPLAFVLICLVIAACATSPTGRRQLMLVSEDQAIDASQDAYIKMLKPLDKKGKLDKDPEMTERVHEITARLIAQAM